ncbi:chromate resistance protein [Sphingomonas sp. SUN019]|uniref:chromate resistance protein ChrB domain-containing protein n=1 Tax=Sphingomonas sp. SUN019 TaxID=2937788 RepID=UPI0021644DEE|nr:chromate resistance protein ChrB domain-containing protein [Sphingomonas sp. SUN019]UVO51761.1 chromate resistance protein [Sphingomonas sp. SUN019]
MPQLHAIAADRLARLIGLPTTPRLMDLRADAATRIPGSTPFDSATAVGQTAVIIDADGGAEAHAAAARLRHDGVAAEVLEGGFAAWRAAGLPLVPENKLPPRDAQGRTLWVTRARPKVDRIACPWLIRRFVDPHAIFLFVTPGDVPGVAAATGAAPFDIAGDGMLWSHRGELCTFDVMVDELGLSGIAPLAHVATIVRGADTARLDIVPEAAGLLAASLGLSRMYADDHAQLDAGMTLYDAFYRWARDARDETHDWTQHQPRGAKA